MSGLPVIEVLGLRVRYAAKGKAPVNAVQDLSFSVLPGEVVGFLGPNGAGKSSTIKVMMGFVEAAGGECRILGEPAGTPASRKRTGYLPEVALYYPFLTPLETLKLYGELQGLRGRSLRDEAERLLNAVGLGAVLHKQNRTMSKGMLQRVGIAQALLGNPELLLLDEVTSGLDPVGRRELRDILKERQRNGATLFFSSHELAEVEMLCDRILLIDKGKLLEERIVAALKDELRRYAIAFRGEVSMVGLTDDLDAPKDGFVSARFDSKPKLLEAIARVQQSGGEVLDVVSQEGSLEEYFVNAIGRSA